MISTFGFARVCACDGECSCMFCIVCTVMLTEINFSAKYVCMFYFALSLDLLCFSFCLSRELYVHVVPMCSWCAHACSWCAHVYDECSCMFCIAFEC